jgi:hypothetical protein
MMGWVKFTSDTNNYAHVFHLGGTFSYDGITDALGTDSDGTTRRASCVGGTASQTPTSGSFTANVWIHLAMVRESTTSLKFYADGAEITGLACSSDVGSRTATSLMTFLNYNQFALAGKMADVKAWASALNSTEVGTEMGSKAPVKASPWCYWTMEGGTLNDCLVDSSGNSRNLSHAGATGNVVDVDGDYPTFATNATGSAIGAAGTGQIGTLIIAPRPPPPYTVTTVTG